MHTASILLLGSVGIFSSTSLLSQNNDRNTVVAVDLNSETLSGVLGTFHDNRLTLVGDVSKDFETTDLLSLSFPKRKIQEIHGGSLLFLDNGDRLVARPLSMNDERLLAEWPNFPKLPPVSIPLETLRGIVLKVPEQKTTRKQLFHEIIERRHERDLVHVSSGDRFSGEILSLDRDSLAIQAPGGKTLVETKNVLAIAFNSELISFPRTEDRRVLMTFSDGSRITGNRLSLTDEGILEFDALFGAHLSLPAASIVSMQFLGENAVYLSDLEPLAYRFTPFLSQKWNLRRDRSVAGGPLLLRGREYAKGLGMHSQSTATYDLQGNYRLFHATVGIDDSSHRQGNAIIAVEVDGQRVFTSGPITGRTPPLKLEPIDLTGHRQLTLTVEFGPLGDVGDRVDWCNAVIVK